MEPYYDRPPQGSRFTLPLIVFTITLIVAWMVLRHVDLGRSTSSLPPAEPRAVTARGNLADDEKATIQIFENASPSVVYITTLVMRTDFFGTSVTEIPRGTGSGFLWDSAGHVVTNFHVIQGANAAKVRLSDHSTWDAQLVGAEPDKDLAVIRIKAPADRLRSIPIGTSSDLQVGQKVFAIGNPFGLDQTLTTGIVSALGRSIQAVTGRTIEDVIQTDAAINPGNSGGPLLDSAGRLIGVNTAIYSPSGSSAGVGFAVPVDTVNRVVPQIIQHGKVVRPRLGIRMATDVITRQLGLKGVLIADVEEGSGAAAAGLRGTSQAPDGSIILGDIIQKCDAKKIDSSDDLFNTLDRHKPGDTVELTILRDNRSLAVNVTLQ